MDKQGSLTKCGYCESSIALSANVCPSCGGRWPIYGRSPSYRRIQSLHGIITVRSRLGLSEFALPHKSITSLLGEMALALIGFIVVLPLMIAAPIGFIGFIKVLLFVEKKPTNLQQFFIQIFSEGAIAVGYLFIGVVIFIIVSVIVARCVRIIARCVKSAIEKWPFIQYFLQYFIFILVIVFMFSG